MSAWVPGKRCWGLLLEAVQRARRESMLLTEEAMEAMK